MERDVGCLDQWRVQPFAAQPDEIYSTTGWMLDGDPICTYLDVVVSYLATFGVRPAYSAGVVVLQVLLQVVLLQVRLLPRARSVVRAASLVERFQQLAPCVYLRLVLFQQPLLAFELGPFHDDRRALRLPPLHPVVVG